MSTVPVPKTPRDDVVRALLKYSDSDPNFSELLRLDTTVHNDQEPTARDLGLRRRQRRPARSKVRTATSRG